MLDSDAEARLRHENEQLVSLVVPRELLPTSGYAPLKGLYDIGWKAWEDLPAADYVKDLRKTDDEFVRENSEWTYYLAPLIANGEFTREQIREYARLYFVSVDGFASAIAANAPHNYTNREVRDLIFRHTTEEVGHAELLADFCVEALGWDRIDELWKMADSRPLWSVWDQDFGELKKYPELIYAMIPLSERTLPKQNQILTDSLSKHYGYNPKQLAFFYLHKYVDIYHERIALWILGKYATRKSIQELLTREYIKMREGQAEKNRRMYDAIQKVK